MFDPGIIIIMKPGRDQRFVGSMPSIKLLEKKIAAKLFIVESNNVPRLLLNVWGEALLIQGQPWINSLC